MKKSLLCFSLFIFSFSFCKAQDTLVFKNGDRVVVKIIRVGRSILYSKPPKEKQLAVRLKDVSFIKYADGSIDNCRWLEAQYDSTDKAENPDYQPITINIGMGASYMEAQIPGTPGLLNSFLGSVGPKFLTDSPVYNGTIDYSPFRQLSIGLGEAYEAVTDNPANEQYNRVYTWETERITRTNISMRLFYDFSKTNKADAYLGFRLGSSRWTDQVISNTNTNPFFSTITTMSTPSYNSASFQVVFGLRLYITYSIGFHFELGIGTPYVIEGGISIRLKTRTIKAN